jgi:hypothetical protein
MRYLPKEMHLQHHPRLKLKKTLVRRCKSWRCGISDRDGMRDAVSLAEMRYLLKEFEIVKKYH